AGSGSTPSRRPRSCATRSRFARSGAQSGSPRSPKYRETRLAASAASDTIREPRSRDVSERIEPEMTTTFDFDDAGVYIDGRWSRGEGETVTVFDPRTGSALAAIPGASAEQTHAVLASAGRAQRAWARTTAMERGRLLRAVADVIAANREALAALLTSEVG